MRVKVLVSLLQDRQNDLKIGISSKRDNLGASASPAVTPGAFFALPSLPTSQQLTQPCLASGPVAGALSPELVHVNALRTGAHWLSE